ncbi:ABC transporter ATP-binding protein/permease [Mesorhizobium sp. C280B]|uniref:ABC transporter ATP-binding protein n=1 Tax=Mesorhizobium sp. C280B TaxID=2956828 RepID=UPI00333C5C0B
MLNKTLRALIAILTPSDLVRGGLLIILLAATAAVEAAGVASVAPFLAVLANPDVVHSNAYLRAAYDELGFVDSWSFLLALAIFTLVIVLLVSALRAVVLYVELKFINTRRHQIGVELVSHYLSQPYRFFLDRNTSEMSKTVVSEVDEVIRCGVAPALALAASLSLVAAIFALLLAIDPIVTLSVLSAVAALYSVVYVSVSGFLGRSGEGRLQANRERYQAMSEVLGGIKELKVLGKSSAYLAAFESPSRRFSLHSAAGEVVSQLPKFLAEAVGFAAVCLISVYILMRSGSIGSALPVIGLYAFAGFRLLPAFHKVYSSVALLRFAAPAVGAIAEELRQAPGGGGRHGIGTRGEERLCLRRSIELEHVSFRYDGARPAAICDLSLTIAAGSVTGIVGPSGVGKSTLVDLLLGLLRPDEGRILIDGTPLTEANVRAWQNNIGYVPQHIFLADDTVARNIAFGIEAEAIDRQAVERAARLAQIHDFIVQLPDGYATCVGERGVRLSGGQRQRLGIARALYHEPDIVIFDEATNALDHETEANLLAAVEGLAGQKTIIMITHRLATLHKRARIVELHRGRLRKADTVPVEHAEAVLAVREAPQAAAVGAVHSVAPGR